MSFFPQGSFFGINLIGQSLNAFQYAENVTSDNIANVNTTGASRQVVDLTEAPPIVGSGGYAAHVAGSLGDGVVVSQIQRIHSNSYDALFRGASSSQNYYSAQQNSLSALQSSLGDPTSGVSTQYTAFQTAVNQLISGAGSGQTDATSSNVLSSAAALTTSLNSAAAAISQQKASTLSQASSLVTNVNGILDQIGALNGQIRASTAVGDSPNTYEDQRDQLVDQLSQYVSTQTSIQADGSALVTVNGQALVNDTVVYHLADPTIGTSSSGPVFKINFASTPPATSATPGIPLGSGQLAGLQDLYNDKLTVYGQQLDQFASSLSTEVNRVTQSGYDANGQAGAALFQPIVGSLPISASNIEVGITSPSQLPAALANTAAGSLVVPLNSANNTVDSSAQIDNNATFANAPAAALAGSLSIVDDGITQTFNYSTAAGGNADTIDHFITNFNNGHFGVTASYDSTSQSIGFARDPSNVDANHRALQGANPSTPSFTLTDSNFAVGAPATSLLGVLGAGGKLGGLTPGINAVAQNATNAYAAGDNGAANALLGLFSLGVGIPSIQTTAPAAAIAGTATTVALPAGVTGVMVGQVLTIDAKAGGTAPQENVVVSAVSTNPVTGIESVTFTPANAHAANYSVASAAVQTLGQFYGQIITGVGLDAQTATTGTATQTTLATNIDAVRQSISGINLDDETQNLIKYQNSYAAAARTMNVLNTLLNTVINNLGV
jgi:flagellar hook-associated protein 1 FlgK